MAIFAAACRYTPLAPILVLIFSAFFAQAVFAEDQPKKERFEINSVLMESTFEILGKDSFGKGAVGTGFVIGRAIPSSSIMSRLTLVTAAHVLESMKDDSAILVLRQRGPDGKWKRLPVPLTIREGQKPLWVRHPTADIAAMYIQVPRNVITGPIVTSNMLADDDVLKRFEVHPGDKVLCLGYPFGMESNDAGFPILRSGTIASYPLLPSREMKTFLLDFQVFGGNSGGPVYFEDVNRIYQGVTNFGEEVHFVIGIIIQEEFVSQKTQELFGIREQNYPVGLALVAHASLIKDTIQLLPAPDQEVK